MNNPSNQPSIGGGGAKKLASLAFLTAFGMSCATVPTERRSFSPDVDPLKLLEKCNDTMEKVDKEIGDVVYDIGENARAISPENAVGYGETTECDVFTCCAYVGKDVAECINQKKSDRRNGPSADKKPVSNTEKGDRHALECDVLGIGHCDDRKKPVSNTEKGDIHALKCDILGKGHCDDRKRELERDVSLLKCDILDIRRVGGKIPKGKKDGTPFENLQACINSLEKRDAFLQELQTLQQRFAKEATDAARLRALGERILEIKNRRNQNR